MRAIGHPGYEQVAADRSANTSMWVNPSVKTAIEKKGVVLISAAVAAEEWRLSVKTP
jgi:hypothetical protein